MRKRRVGFGILTRMVVVFWLLGTGAVFGQADSALYDYGRALYELNEKKLYDQTVEILNGYLTRYPEGEKAAEIQFSLGNVHYERKNWDRAFVAYYKTVTLYPNSPQAAEAKVKAGEVASKGTVLSPIKEKLQSMVVSPSVDTVFSDSYFGLLHRLRDLVYPKLNKVLIPECRMFLEAFPEHPDVPLVAEWIGDMYQENKKHWEAVAAYLRVIFIYGSSDRVLGCRLKIGNLYSERLRKYEDAVRTYEAVLQSEVDSLVKGEAQWKLAQVLDEKMTKYSRAVQEYQNLVDRFPASSHGVEALMKKAEIQISKLKQMEGGIAAYRQVVERYPENPDVPEALARIGEVYEKKMKDYEKAVQTYEELSEKYPSSSLAAEKLFKAAEIAEKKLKENDRAIELYQQVVEKFGSERIAQKARQRIESLQKR